MNWLTERAPNSPSMNRDREPAGCHAAECAHLLTQSSAFLVLVLNLTRSHSGILLKHQNRLSSSELLAIEGPKEEPLSPFDLLILLNLCLRVSFGGAEGQNRTVDTSLFRAVLYQLSYLGRFTARRARPVTGSQ